jgi:hypothetical protein
MANIWNLSDFIKHEDKFLATINKLLLRPNPNELVKLGDELFDILNHYSAQALKEIKMLPPPKKFLP